MIFGLADGILFGVRLEPEGLHPEDSLFRILDDIFESEPKNTGDVIQALQRGVTGCVDQMALDKLPRSRSMDDYTMLAAFSEYYHDT